MTLININPLDISAIAPIHATIFSIIIGFISAYALYIYSKSKELEIQILEEASKINIKSFNLPSIIISSGSNGPESKFNTSDKLTRTKFLERLTKIGMALRNHNLSSNSLLTNLPNWTLVTNTEFMSQEDLGYETTLILSSLYNFYPFASLSNSYDFDSSLIKFSNVDAVQEWAGDMSVTLRSLIWTLLVHEQTHQNNLVASNRQFVVKDFLQAAMSMKELVHSVKSLLTQAEARKPNKNIIITGLIISLTGFFCGVIVPMFYKDCDAVLYLLIPTLCYFSIFLYLIYFIAEK